MSTNARQDLVALGFTEIEARAYCELLKRGPATGYKLAGAIHRAPSNIYQTLESLRRKGAILADDTEPRTFRAVPATDLLRSIERSFRRRKQGALGNLRDIGSEARDDRFYSLRTVEQVYERASTMLAAAEEIVLFDLFPGPLSALQPALEQAARAGTTVGGISYGDVPKVDRVQIWNHPWQLVAGTWPGQQITLVVDAQQCLLALLSHNGEDVRHALWTDSFYLSCLHHGGLACEIQVAARKREPTDPIVKLGLLTKPPIGLRKLARGAARTSEFATTKESH